MAEPVATRRWTDEVDEILGADQVVAFAHVTPAKGVVVTPLTNTGLRDRDTGVVTPVSSSVGMWRKLERLSRNSRVAVAYHTRTHGFSERPEYVLLQGSASLTPFEDRSWVDRHRDAWERFAGPRDVGRAWEGWMSVYHWRVGIEIRVERLAVWPDLACEGAHEVTGAPWPSEPPPPQSAPRKGTGPRLSQRRAARRASRRESRLLGWVGADGFPVLVPVEVAGVETEGIALEEHSGLVPPGGRRAGLTAHSFTRYGQGQHQHKHTGWLEADGGRLLYAPHTAAGYWLPRSKLLYKLGAGFVTRRGLREARRAGFVT